MQPSLSLIPNFLHVVRDNYANFNGRARRNEYWMYQLGRVLLFACLFSITFLFFYGSQSIQTSGLTTIEIVLVTIILIFYLLLVIPGLAILVRRLHDTGNSGWMMLVSLIPLVGPIWLLVLLFTDSQPHENKWGESPKFGSNGNDMINQIGVKPL